MSNSVPPVEGMPDAGNPLLQRLVNSIEIVDDVACLDFVLVYDLRDHIAGLEAELASRPRPTTAEDRNDK